MKDKKKILLASLGILLLVLATIGVTFAVFTYTKLGTTENTVTTGTLKFLYTENTGVGNGINIENAFPVSDEVGKGYNTDKYVFDFSVEATNSGVEEIPYEVTLRKKDGSTLSNDSIKVYLTDMTDEADTSIVSPTLYSDLKQTSIDVSDEVEKTIYNGNVLGGELTYKKDFRLRMWIDEKSNQDDINGKTFTALVNVYSNVPLVSEEEEITRNDVEISSVLIGNEFVEKVENKSYDYEMVLPEGTTSTTINVETVNPNSEVKIEKIDSLTYLDLGAQKVSISKTINLTNGVNYFKITIVSENKEVTDEYILKITVAKLTYLKDEILKNNSVVESEPTLTTSSNNSSDKSGLYKSTATNDGKPTYYFRGNVENNYVDFAGFTWRIVRINEDGTIRIILEDGIDESLLRIFNQYVNDHEFMYYTTVANTAKSVLTSWNTANIVNKNYSDYVATGDYYCEQAKAALSNDYVARSNADMLIYSNYVPDFKCVTDKNKRGFVNVSVGLISYDEAVHAGGYYNQENNDYFLHMNDITWWTMSPAGYNGAYQEVRDWTILSNGSIGSSRVIDKRYLRPVINLRSNVIVIGTGDVDNHFVVQYED